MLRCAAFALCCAFLVAAAQSAPLLLTPLIEKGELQQARQQSKISYEGQDLGYSAFITVPSASGNNHNNMFFWLQPCLDGCSSNSSFVMWMQGGPGGPSTFGALAEIGNWYADAAGKLNRRCLSWCKDNVCLFIDQPAETGFSFQTNATGHYDPKNIEYTRTSKDATEQMWQVLQQLFKVFPEYKDLSFVVTGESYGGLYTSNMAMTIQRHNDAGDPKINLRGVSVGDPIINNAYQWPTYADTLYGMGVVMLDEREQIREIMRKGVANLGNCPVAFSYWNSVWNDNGGGGAPGIYFEFTGSSMTENVLLGAEPAGFGDSVAWLQLPQVEQALHYDGIPTSSFAEGGKVYSTMVNSGDFCSNSSDIFATLFLTYGHDITIYSGTADPLLGPPTTEAGVVAMFDFANSRLGSVGVAAKKAYDSAKKAIWKIDSSKDVNPAGYAKCIQHPSGSNRFCYVVIRNAGHESPAFEPAPNFDNFYRFLERRPYSAAGDAPATVPQGPTCGCSGVPPFAGTALPKCKDAAF